MAARIPKKDDLMGLDRNPENFEVRVSKVGKVLESCSNVEYLRVSSSRQQCQPLRFSLLLT